MKKLKLSICALLIAGMMQVTPQTQASDRWYSRLYPQETYQQAALAAAALAILGAAAAVWWHRATLMEYLPSAKVKAEGGGEEGKGKDEGEEGKGKDEGEGKGKEKAEVKAETKTKQIISEKLLSDLNSAKSKDNREQAFTDAFNDYENLKAASALRDEELIGLIDNVLKKDRYNRDSIMALISSAVGYKKKITKNVMTKHKLEKNENSRIKVKRIIEADLSVIKFETLDEIMNKGLNYLEFKDQFLAGIIMRLPVD